MRKTFFAIVILGSIILFFSLTNKSAERLIREEGLSVHVLPKRVADLDEANQLKWGFMVSQSFELKPPLERPIFNKPEELIEYFRTMPQVVQKNGIWMVVTHPDAYSKEENVSIKHLKEICIKEDIPLFRCRAFKLPHGWERIN